MGYFATNGTDLVILNSEIQRPHRVPVIRLALYIDSDFGHGFVIQSSDLSVSILRRQALNAPRTQFEKSISASRV
jgi:hypothetical protein